jgi:carbonic anhydrase
MFWWSVAAHYTPIRHLSLHSLLPETQQYMTYEGSTTHPGCWETTVWIILNRPTYITKQEVATLPGHPSTRCCSLLCEWSQVAQNSNG